MSYIPKSERARKVLEDLTLPEQDGMPWWWFLHSDIGRYDREALREVLIAVVCPAPCVGHVNDVGWHTLCENAANAALEALDAGNPLGAWGLGPKTVPEDLEEIP